jgi:nucleoside-diphosphate-sugar epimerase
LGQSLVTYFSGYDDIKLFGHSRTPDKTAEKLNNTRITIIDNYLSGQLDSLNIDCIIHLAGIAHDLSNTYTAQDYFKVNDEDTRKLYDAFRQSKTSQFIFLSSIKAAVDKASVPVTESVACKPVTPYGQSKLQAENYIQSQTLSADKKYYILRPCMVHGPGNKGNLNLLYKFVKAGLPYPLGAFPNQRSFLTVNNFNFIVHRLLEGNAASGIYHLADDGFLSTAELYVLIAKETGRRSRVLNIPQGIVKFLTAIIGKKHMINKLTEDMMVSNQKIKQNINQPLPVSLREGLAKTIQSFREF